MPHLPRLRQENACPFYTGTPVLLWYTASPWISRLLRRHHLLPSPVAAHPAGIAGRPSPADTDAPEETSPRDGDTPRISQCFTGDSARGTVCGGNPVDSGIVEARTITETGTGFRITGFIGRRHHRPQIRHVKRCRQRSPAAKQHVVFSLANGMAAGQA